ncbi:MAG: class I SAM-dependent methyltransferase [Anaerolineae bacterium]|nr:class I SAM-dependent methyltransferase [Anaerolineae bacterium]
MSAAERSRLYEHAPLLDAAGGVIRPGGVALTDRALAFCALAAGARVLDVGCGPAASVAHLRTAHGLDALGLDPSALLLRSGRNRAGALPVIQACGEQLPVAAGRFDAVLAECSLSVMGEPSRALAECRRVLRPDGFLIVSDMYARDAGAATALGQLPVISCLTGAVSEMETIARVAAHGFAVRLWEDHSEALKVFAARLIWAGALPSAFWGELAPCAEGPAIQSAIARSRPGYYLMIAQKSVACEP